MTGSLVLNVNDRVANLYMMSKMLSNAGFRVVEARTGTEALQVARARETRPVLILLDVHLPDLSGIEVCRQLKTDPETVEIKIVFTSASTLIAPDTPPPGADVGADGYLEQPFDQHQLISVVRSFVRPTGQPMIATRQPIGRG